MSLVIRLLLYHSPNRFIQHRLFSQNCKYTKALPYLQIAHQAIGMLADTYRYTSTHTPPHTSVLSFFCPQHKQRGTSYVLTAPKLNYYVFEWWHRSCQLRGDRTHLHQNRQTTNLGQHLDQTWPQKHDAAVAKGPVSPPVGFLAIISALSHLPLLGTSAEAAILNNSHTYEWIPTKQTSLL